MNKFSFDRRLLLCDLSLWHNVHRSDVCLPLRFVYHGGGCAALDVMCMVCKWRILLHLLKYFNHLFDTVKDLCVAAAAAAAAGSLI